ncbi:hypothetical protein C8R42DRAFT_722221 [Lentinula raphanica]|nr:hypothetical protein C8R42DRAFT_722221 [Lentinula raphanica]
MLVILRGRKPQKDTGSPGANQKPAYAVLRVALHEPSPDSPPQTDFDTMLVLPLDVTEAIVRVLLARNDRATVKSLALVRSSFTPVCQRFLLSRVTIPSAKSEGRRRYKHSAEATQKLLQSSPHLVTSIRSLTILGSSSSGTQLDPALVDVLYRLTDVTSFTWKAGSNLLSPTRWGELPQQLQDAIRDLIRRPLLNTLSLQFADLADFLQTTIHISPSLTLLSLRGPDYSNVTLEMTRPSIVLSDENGEMILSRLTLFVTACKLEWIEDEDIFFGWMTAVRPYLSLERLQKLAVLRCSLKPALELPWGPLLYHESVRPGLEELWFDMVSTQGPPVVVFLETTRNLCEFNKIPGYKLGINLEFISVFRELARDFSSSSPVLDPRKVPWWNLDAAIALLPALTWIGMEFVDCRREAARIIPPYRENMLPLLTEKGILQWSTSRVEFPAT